jgi:hypothetical protein
MPGDEREPLLKPHSDEAHSRLAQLYAREVPASAQEHIDYPVDHGYVAWMQVLGGFIIFANSWYVPSHQPHI